MASVQKTIEIIFAGTDKASGTITAITGKMDEIAGGAEAATQPLADMFDAVVKLDAVLAAMAVGGLAIAVNEAGKFGDSFNEISTLTDASADSLDKFKSDIVAYARDSTASIDDINKSIYTAISAGTDYKDSLAVLNTAEQLSIAGKADLEATTRLLVSSLNAYGASTDEAANYSDALFQAVKLGQTTLPELATSLAQVSTTAANSGVSFDELMAAIAAVTATGAPTTQAITAIKAAISAIVKPSSEAAKEAERLGIQFDAAALNSKGLDGVLKDVYASTGGATEHIVLLFGSVESLPAVMTLGKDAAGTFANALTGVQNKAGSTAEAHAKMAENMALTNQNLANNVKATFIQVGSELLNGYTDIAKSVTEIFKSIGVSIDAGAFDEVFAALNEFGGGVATFLNDLASALPEALEKIDWAGFISALKEIGASVGDLFGDFDPKDPDDVAKAIQFVVDSLESLIRVSKGMVDAVKPVIQQIIQWVDEFNKLDDSTKQSIGEITGWGKVVNSIAGLISPVTGAINGLSTAIFALAGSNMLSSITSLTKLSGVMTVLAGIGSIAIPVSIAIIGSAAVYALLSKLDEWQDKRLEINPEVNWQDLDNDMPGYVPITIKTEMSKDDLTSDFEWINSEIEQFNNKIIYPKAKLDTSDIASDLERIDSEISNTPIHIPTETDLNDSYQTDWDDLNDDLLRHPVIIRTTADDKSIEDTKKKIQQSFSSASMGDIKLGFKIKGGDGVGPVGDVADWFKDSIENSEKIPLDDLFDPSGMADLFDSLSKMTSTTDIQNARRAIEQQLKLQKETADAQNRLTKGQAAIAEQMWKAANIMQQQSGETDSTIKIDASGVEPEIEAFMYKILKKIQIRANESGAEFLLAAAS